MKTQEILTSNLSDFGFLELKKLEKLIRGWREQGLPVDFQADEVKAVMNRNSGYVFLTNADFQVAMMNGDKLESFYTCPECGHEGFMEEMEHGDDNDNCKEYLNQIKEK